MQVKHIKLPEHFGQSISVSHVFTIGDEALLDKPMLGFFCSVRCPASIILKTYDYAQILKTQETAIISGFHSPIEKEVLITLLKGTVPIIVCPARHIENMRIPADWKPAIEAGRLLIVSPFPSHQKRATAQSVQQRNQFVADLANPIWVAYADADGKTEALAIKLLVNQRTVLTFDTDLNNNLLKAGSGKIQL